MMLDTYGGRGYARAEKYHLGRSFLYLYAEHRDAGRSDRDSTYWSLDTLGLLSHHDTYVYQERT